MTFNSDALLRDAGRATTADADIAAACHGILDTELRETGGDWYGPVNDALSQVKGLAQRWLTDYATMFRGTVLTDLRTQARAVTAMQPSVQSAFEALEANPDGDKTPVTDLLNRMKDAVEAVGQPIASYERTLQAWGNDLRPAQDNLNRVIGQVQDDAAHLQSQIAAINNQIGMLQGEIQKGRKAIDDAQSKRTSGIIETIFGVILAPVTLGTSLILAGVGVASIVEAESQIHAMEDQIRTHEAEIHDLTRDLDADQAQIVTLQGLLLPAQGASDSVALIEQRLVDMRATLDGFTGEVSEVVGDIDRATTAHSIVVAASWADAAFNEWAKVIDGLDTLIGETETVVHDPVRAVSRQAPIATLAVRPSDEVPALPSRLAPAVVAADGTTGIPLLEVGRRRYWIADKPGDRPCAVLVGVTGDNRLKQVREQPGVGPVTTAALSADGAALTLGDDAGRTVSVSVAKLAL